MNTLDVNTVNLRNVYGTALGNTTGLAGSANNQTAVPAGYSSSPSSSAVADTNTHPDIARSLSIGGQANPVVGAIVFLVLIVGLSFLAKRVGTVDDFKNIRVSPYNVLLISMAAIIGMPVWKYIFTKFPVAGVSTWVASA